MEFVILFIALFVTIFGISYFFLITRNKERLALIQSGADASLFQIPPKRGRSWGYYLVLVFGLMTMSIGLGIFLTYFLMREMDTYQPQLYVASTFFFGGLGLTISFFTIRSLNKIDEEKNQTTYTAS